MANKEPKQWITVNGQHIPIYDGETKDQAVNRYIAKTNEEKKQKDIARNKAQADKLNGKKQVSNADTSRDWRPASTPAEREKQKAELQELAKKSGVITRVKYLNRIMMIDKGWTGTEAEYYEHSQKEQDKYATDLEKEKKEKAEKERIAKETKRKQLEEELKTQPKEKVEQYKIIQKTNPMLDDYHVGIRKPSDIKTWKEVLDEDTKDGESFAWGDFSRQDAEKAMKTGKITIYSSYPIKDGVFVSTSKVQAEEYAGGQGNRVYSKTVPLKDVAWINGDEGQFAKLRG